MRKKLSILVAVVVMSTVMFGQTVQERRQVASLENEIFKTRKDLAYLQRDLELDFSVEIDTLKSQITVLSDQIELEKDSIRREVLRDSLVVKERKVNRLSKRTMTVNRSETQLNIVSKKAKIADLEREWEIIFRRYATASTVSKELSPRELRRRERADYFEKKQRREELVLRKIEDNISSPTSSVDPSGSAAAQAGYKVILVNDYMLPIKFTISPINGGDSPGHVVDPKKEKVIYLIPGKYFVSFQSGGESYGQNKVLNIDGTVHSIKGKECFGFAYMSPYGM